MGGALVVSFLLGGCQSKRLDPAVEEAISQATGLGESIAFRIEEVPVDEPALTTANDHLGVEAAVRRAVSTDPGLQSALARVRIAMADADQARLLQNPILDLILRWGPGKPQIEASLAQDVVHALQTPRRSSAADNRLRRAAADAVTAALDVVSGVQERYTAVQATDELIPLLEGRLDLLGKLAGVARDRLDAGEGTRSDVTTLDAQHVDLQVEIASARLQQREDRLRLARLIGEPSGAAVWTLDPWKAPASVVATESRWVDAALAHRPEVQSIAWELAALGDEYALTRLLPWQGAAAGVDAQRDGDWFAGPSISAPLPVFDTGQARRARVTAAQIEARHDLTLARRKVVEEVRIAYESLAANRANLQRVQRELIPLQQQRRQQAEDAYRAGQTDVTQLFLAEQNLRATQARAIDIERQTTLSLVRLQRAAGGTGAAAGIETGQ